VWNHLRFGSLELQWLRYRERSNAQICSSAALFWRLLVAVSGAFLWLAHWIYFFIDSLLATRAGILRSGARRCIKNARLRLS
jgi:uncharacterized membrane protein